MTKRIFLAGVLGGIVMFIWTSIAHMVLPLGYAGVSELPNESAVLSAMQTNIAAQTGLYIFPGFGLGTNPSRAARNEAMKHMDEKLAQNPSGLLMYHPAGSRTIKMGQLLGIEFATELLEAILAVFLLGLTRLVTFGARVGFVLVAGIIAALATNVSYWNWHGFPGSYTAAYMSIQAIGFLCVGIVAALVLPKSLAPTVR